MSVKMAGEQKNFEVDFSPGGEGSLMGLATSRDTVLSLASRLYAMSTSLVQEQTYHFLVASSSCCARIFATDCPSVHRGSYLGTAMGSAR